MYPQSSCTQTANGKVHCDRSQQGMLSANKIQMKKKLHKFSVCVIFLYISRVSLQQTAHCWIFILTVCDQILFVRYVSFFCRFSMPFVNLMLNEDEFHMNFQTLRNDTAIFHLMNHLHRERMLYRCFSVSQFMYIDTKRCHEVNLGEP